MNENCTSNASRQFLELGKIGRPHGIRGELRLFLHNPSSDLIFRVDKVYLGTSPVGSPTPYRIHHLKAGAKFHIISLKGVQHKGSAQELCGHFVFVARSVLPKLDAGEFYVDDLIGMVVTCDGESVGIVAESREQGGIEVVTVANEMREIQIPVVEQYVRELDTASGIFIVQNIDGLPIHEIAPKAR